MKFKFLVPSIIAVVIITACNNSAPVPLVKTVYSVRKFNFQGQEISQAGTTTTFFYTPEGKISYSLSSNGNKTAIEQTPTSVLYTETDSAGKIIGSVVVYVNGLGQEDSVEQKNGASIVASHKFIYNKDGFLIEERHYVGGRLKNTVKHTVVEGNSIKDELIYPFATDTQRAVNPKTGKEEVLVIPYDNLTTHKTYFTDKIRMPANANFGNLLRDRGSVHLEKTDVFISSNKDTTNIVDHRFTFDKHGRVVSAVAATRSGSEYDSVAYTYY